MAAVPESDLPDNLRGKAVPADDLPSAAPAAPTTPPGQIPGAGAYTAPPAGPQMAGGPTIPQKMAMYAGAVPAAGLAAGALRYGARGTQFAPYAERAVEAMVPKTLGGLTGATGLAGLSAIPAELSRRAAEKRGAGPVGQMAAETAGGMAAAVPALAAQRAGSQLRQTIGKAFSPEAKALGERLAATTREQAAEATARARAGQQQPLEELRRIERAQEQLAGRGPVAGQREAARQQGVQASLADVSPTAGILGEDVGGVIQPIGRENIKRLAETRTREAITNIKDPGFQAARQREAAGEFMATDPQSGPLFKQVLQEVEDQIAKTPEPYASDLRTRLASIRGRKTQIGGKEAAFERSLARMEGRPPRTERTQPMSLDEAEYLRRLLTDKNLADASGFGAIDIARRQDLAKKLTAAMEAFEPRTTQYLQKYRELSAPIERATAGRGAALTEADLLAEQEVLFGADKQAVKQYYLNGSQERAERLLQLIGGKKPEVVNAIRGYLRSELEPKSAAQSREFIANNEGLLRVFPELREPLNKVAASKSVAETGGKAAAEKATTAGKRLETAAKQPARSLEEQRALQQKYEGLQNTILTAPRGKETDVAKTLADSLYKDKLIDAADHRNLLEQIANVKNTAKSQEEAKQKLRTLFVRLGWGVGGASAAGTAGYVLSR